MSYQCTLFKNTGFNAVNIPDSPGLLAVVGSPVTVPALEIVQNRFLNSVRVHAIWDTVKDVDYCMVGDFYYMVEGVNMLNGDTAELALIPDFITSAGGIGALNFVDGITERVKVTGDSYGKYTEPDELMNPSEPLELSTFSVVPSASHIDIIESTLDLFNNATNQAALTYEDTVSGESVTVPQNVPLTAETNYSIGGNTVTGSTGCFRGTDAQIKKGVQKARALGAESAIISHYKLPVSYGTVSETLGFFSTITGVDTTENITLPYMYGSYTPNNLKILYSDITKYGLLSMNGDKVEFSPADIYDGGTSPTLRILSDPRPEGKPYFRYNSYKGNTSLNSFFLNCVSGADWEQLPLIYTDKSGNALTRIQHDADSKEKWENFSREATSAALGGAFTGFSRGLANGPIAAAAGFAFGAVQGVLDARQMLLTYRAAAENEAMDYAVNNLIIKPEITFPYKANMLRETLGNGVVCYRYRYSDNDMRRIDKLLTMYGYKHTKALQSTDFTNGTYFNYVKAHGVAVSGTLPKWWCDGISAQLTAGTRIWHTAPNPSYYSLAN